MARKIRLFLAVLSFLLINILFLDFTGAAHAWFGWIAKIQFLPALLALNVGVIVALILLTLLLGRIYCSVICPLGVFQDLISWLSSKRKKNRFSYSKPLNTLRCIMLWLFIVAFISGVNSLIALFAPYSAYGRIANTLLQPIYIMCNNLLAQVAEHYNSYMFYSVDVWIKGLPVMIIAIITLLVVGILSWRGGRTYCNTICPVGTLLGFVAKYSWLKPVINTDKCNSCGLCARNCKSSCINYKEHNIDYSRCVACMDCIGKCRQGAITYSHPKKSASTASEKSNEKVDQSKRIFFTATSAVIATSVIKAQEKKVDGGLAIIKDKKIPERNTKITPPGSLSINNLTRHCTACQLCISACPNQVLRPSTSYENFMQPEVSYERGYCRPECNECSQVCPAGAIKPITKAEKSSVQVGHAVWIRKNCIPVSDGVECGNCARHCPSGAIQMVPIDANYPESLKIPAINEVRCIGCGACENLCPSRPFSAIYVEGHEMHKSI